MGSLRGVQDALAHGVGQRDLAGGDEVLLLGGSVSLLAVAAAVDPEHVLLELGQLTRALQDLAVDDVGRVALGVAVLARVQVQHELRQRPVQPRHRPAQEGKARTCQQRAGIEVQPQRRAEIDMVLDMEVECPRDTPASHLDVAALVGAHRHAVVRQVGQTHHHGRQLGLDRLQALGRGLELVADAADLRHHRRSVLALGLELADLPAEGVAARLQFLGAGLDRLALGLQRTEALDVEEGLRVAPGRQALDDTGQVAAQQLDIEHRGVSLAVADAVTAVAHALGGVAGNVGGGRMAGAARGGT